MKTLNIQLTPELDHDLSFCEQVKGESKTDLINEAIKNYVSQLIEEYEDGKEVMGGMNDPNNRLYSSEEVEKILDAVRY